MTPIDFHDPANQQTYAGRDATDSWREAVRAIREPEGLDVLDLGCGGGIYARALAEMGAATVVGCDSSAAMLATAQDACKDLPHVRFVQGEANEVPLPDGTFDLILARGLIHHLPTLDQFAHELHRLLRRSGTAIIQDRTPDDIAVPAGPTNIRGYFFDVFPRLSDIDRGRRHPDVSVRAALMAAGFPHVKTDTVEEIRVVHADREALAARLRARDGRSTLHELDDAELEQLVAHITAQLPPDTPIEETDRWTIWSATRP